MIRSNRKSYPAKRRRPQSKRMPARQPLNPPQSRTPFQPTRGQPTPRFQRRPIVPSPTCDARARRGGAQRRRARDESGAARQCAASAPSPAGIVGRCPGHAARGSARGRTAAAGASFCPHGRSAAAIANRQGVLETFGRPGRLSLGPGRSRFAQRPDPGARALARSRQHGGRRGRRSQRRAIGRGRSAAGTGRPGGRARASDFRWRSIGRMPATTTRSTTTFSPAARRRRGFA